MSSQLSLLVNLAKTDGVIDEKEIDLIHRIGRAHGLSRESIDDIIQSPNKPEQLTELNADEKFDILYNLVHLMKVDGKVFDEEITYCMSMAKKLGYPLEAVMDLYGLVHANVKLNSEIQKLKRKYV